MDVQHLIIFLLRKTIKVTVFGIVLFQGFSVGINTKHKKNFAPPVLVFVSGVMVRFTEPKPRINRDFIAAGAPDSIERNSASGDAPKENGISLLIVQLMFCANR